MVNARSPHRLGDFEIGLGGEQFLGLRHAAQCIAADRNEAAAAVPDELCDLRALVGPPERIRERYRAWEGSGATGLLIRTAQDAAIDLMAEVAGTAHS